MNPLDVPLGSRMHRIRGWAWLVLALIGNGGASIAGTPEARPMNVVLIMADDLRAEGGPLLRSHLRTPHLDRIAARGVRFDRAYAQYPVCNPSRSSLLLGLRCEQTGIVGNDVFFRRALPGAPTFPELLRQSGWTTHAFGKILHAGNTSETVRPEWLDRGLSWDVAEVQAAASPHRRGRFQNLSRGRLAWCEVGILEGGDDEQPDGRTAMQACRSIRDLEAAGKPWMVAAGFHRPHDPFHVPRKYFDLHPKETLRPHRDRPDQSASAPMALPGQWSTVFGEFGDEERVAFLQAYLAGISFMDAQVGRILDTLDELRLWDRTVVIFLGDHGYHLGERGWWNKNTLFDRSCRAPLMIAAPDGLRGSTCSAPVEFVDLFPTVVDYCRVPAPGSLPGRSLRPLLRDVRNPHKEGAFTLVVRGSGRFGRSVTDGRWRLTRWSDGTEELYDHQTDPEEDVDLSGRPDTANHRRKLARMLESLPPWPKPKP
ncbi:MAG: hypothetical protein RIT19_654 [Verrucomicrobiota bacterium]|jgi:iduronate 2-sulfatase